MDEVVNYFVMIGDGMIVCIEMVGVENEGFLLIFGIFVKYVFVIGVKYEILDDGVIVIIFLSGVMYVKSFFLKLDYYGGYCIVIDFV